MPPVSRFRCFGSPFGVIEHILGPRHRGGQIELTELVLTLAGRKCVRSEGAKNEGMIRSPLFPARPQMDSRCGVSVGLGDTFCVMPRRAMPKISSFVLRGRPFYRRGKKS